MLFREERTAMGTIPARAGSTLNDLYPSSPGKPILTNFTHSGRSSESAICGKRR
uniref:Uncharacterized protein n=1 Tax=Streptomyces avermitilis (strain ATCC 31267 / DSM 46492 / JCM 5070 / NBRC 14893 / NCIMB 12804 / NRRL 8165 / MA-4680) TaxID=227882 RepID=A0A143SZM2_STRAW|nr:hypothetical protein SAVERM_2p114 [Streptomyces avermitilis MA-4680 = NBRC 14893]